MLALQRLFFATGNRQLFNCAASNCTVRIRLAGICHLRLFLPSATSALSAYHTRSYCSKKEDDSKDKWKESEFFEQFEKRKSEIMKLAPILPLMDIPQLFKPNLVAQMYNSYFLAFQMPSIDPEFELTEFLMATKKAIVVVSEMLAHEDFSGLENLLVPSAYEEVTKNLKKMTTQQKMNLQLHEDDIRAQFVGLCSKLKKKGRQHVEISIVGHSVKELPLGDNIEELEKLMLNQLSRMYLNVRFRREYSGVTNVPTEWKIAAINFFLPKMAMTSYIKSYEKTSDD